MKRATREWLRENAEEARGVSNPSEESKRFAEIEAELKRLRRIARAARAWQKSIGVEIIYARAERALIAALKKGGRK